MALLHLTASVHSVAGSPQRPNEDAAVARQLPDGSWIAVVADGVGSARAGGEAARRAVEMLLDYWSARPAAWSPRRALAAFVERINRQLHQESHAAYAAPELVTTLVIAIVSRGRLYGANLGDSALYLWRDGNLEQLSQAHVVEERGHEHVLTQAVGLAETAVPAFVERDLRRGDRVLLCTDGVWAPLGIAGLITACTQQAAARSLVTAARQLEALPASADDASAIVLEVNAREDRSESDQVLDVPPVLAEGQEFTDGTLVRALDSERRVWVARDDSGREVVLKFPPLEAAQDAARAEAFLREAWQAARIQSSEFVTSHVPQTPVLQYYLQDYIPAPTLREVLDAGPLPVEAVLALADFLARAVQHLAQRDLAHGDLKPENVLVLRRTGPWDYRLVDLGSAGELFSVTSRAGTASYLAPERFHSAPLSERTEIFSIGVILFASLTGRLPFGEIERFQTPRFPAAARPPSTWNAAVPGWFDAVIQRALAPSPLQRYAHVSELRHDLLNPKTVEPFYPAHAPLLERHPVRFYQLLCVLLALAHALRWWWAVEPGP